MLHLEASACSSQAFAYSSRASPLVGPGTPGAPHSLRLVHIRLHGLGALALTDERHILCALVSLGHFGLLLANLPLCWSHRIGPTLTYATAGKKWGALTTWRPNHFWLTAVRNAIAMPCFRAGLTKLSEAMALFALLVAFLILFVLLGLWLHLCHDGRNSHRSRGCGLSTRVWLPNPRGCGSHLHP